MPFSLQISRIFRKHKERTGSYVDGLKLKDEDSLSVSMDFLGISA